MFGLYLHPINIQTKNFFGILISTKSGLMRTVSSKYGHLLFINESDLKVHVKLILNLHIIVWFIP